jgi:AcrR family transcriptional regulator
MPTSIRQRRKEERPQQLLEAALELFVEKGFAATRSEEVAARAGVSKGTLYLYFPSKEELLKAVIRHTLASEIVAGAQMAAAHTGSAGDLLVDVMSQWWGKILNDPASGVFKLVITEVRNFPDIAQFYFEEVVQPGTAIISQIIQRGIDSAEFQPVDVMLTVHSVVLPMVMLCLHKHSLGACNFAQQSLLDAPAFIHHHMALLVQGLRAPVGTTGPSPSP